MNRLSETSSSFGVGFRPPHYEWVATRRPAEIDVFEIVSDNFLGVGGRAWHHLQKLREDYPVLMHGVGLSIGSLEPRPDRGYLKQLKSLASAIEAPMVSDHLSWSRFGTHNTHDLLPIVYTKSMLDRLVAKLDEVQSYLGRRFYLENPSAYVSFTAGDYEESEFFRELLDRSGAGMLLDINNLYVNQRNLGRDPLAFLRTLRPEHVGYFHLAGHSDEGEVLVDTHDQPVPDSVWSLYAEAKTLFPGKTAIIEWDGNIPEFPRLIEECEKARRLSPGSCARTKDQDDRKPSRQAHGRPAEEIHGRFYQEIIRPHGTSADGLVDLDQECPTPARLGLRVYNHAYFSRLEEVLRENFPALAFVTGQSGFRHLVVDYLGACPPEGHALDTVGQGMVRFLLDESQALTKDYGVPRRVLSDLSALEWAQCEVATALDMDFLGPEDLQAMSPSEWETQRFTLHPASRVVDSSYAILPVVQSALRAEAPSRPLAEDTIYVVWRDGHGVQERILEAEEAVFLRALRQGGSFHDLAQSLGARSSYFDGDQMRQAATQLMAASAAGWLVKAGDAYLTS